jgi:hypothetical protein
MEVMSWPKEGRVSGSPQHAAMIAASPGSTESGMSSVAPPHPTAPTTWEEDAHQAAFALSKMTGRTAVPRWTISTGAAKGGTTTGTAAGAM